MVENSDSTMVITPHILFIHSPADGHLGYFYFFLAMKDNTAMNIYLHTFAQTCVQFPGIEFQDGIARTDKIFCFTF